LLAYADVRLAARDELVRAFESCRSMLLEHRAAIEEIATKLLRIGRIDGVSAAGVIRACRGVKEAP
jgi:hypothetical protein